MLRNLLAGALVALLASPVALLSAQATEPDAITPDCISGQAFGAWDLPSEGGSGHVRGLLLQVGERQLALEAKLIPVRLPGDLRGGRIDGVLLPLTPDGVAQLPIAEVHGTYVVGRDGRGRFEAAFTELTRDPARSLERLGRIAGLFRDPQGDGENTLGRFAGRWVLCR